MDENKSGSNISPETEDIPTSNDEFGKFEDIDISDLGISFESEDIDDEYDVSSHSQENAVPETDNHLSETGRGGRHVKQGSGSFSTKSLLSR